MAHLTLLDMSVGGNYTKVLFFNDWAVYPGGVNAGGGEAATMALALAFKRQGYRVVCCANLPQGEVTYQGIEFWNFGKDYAVHRLVPRLAQLGSCDVYCATLVHPLLFLRELQNIRARIVINHAQTAFASGLEPATVMEIIDEMTCVSQALRSRILARGSKPEKISVIKNGTDPEIFRYQGPEGRDYKKLVFIGRIEPAKGIHLLVQAYAQLCQELPGMSLEVFGDQQYWPEFSAQILTLEQQYPGLKFHGKVPQNQLAATLRSAGLLVFPSISFESAGLALIDAQASGCPVVTFAMGGTPEYVEDPSCGRVIRETNPEQYLPSLVKTVRELLLNPDQLRQMSLACATIGVRNSWDARALAYAQLAEKIGNSKKSVPQRARLTARLERTVTPAKYDPTIVLQDHEAIAAGEELSDEQLHAWQAEAQAASLLWQGLRAEGDKKLEKARKLYEQAAACAGEDDWQPQFRLALLLSEEGNIAAAGRYAREVLRRSPQFPYRVSLEKLIAFSHHQGTV